MSDRNVEIKFEGSLGVYENVVAGARVVIYAGPLEMGADAVAVTSA